MSFWKRVAPNLGYIAEIEGSAATLYVCQAEMFPDGYTDTNGNAYSPRMFGLTIDRDVGGFSFRRSGFETKQASFSLVIGDYDDVDFWSSFADGNRLEGGRVAIRMVDIDDGTTETLFHGHMQPVRNAKFAPKSKTKFKALEGPRELHRPLAMQAFVPLEFWEDSSTVPQGEREEDRSPAVVKPWLFGNPASVVEGVIFAEGNGATAPPAHVVSSDRAICFGYRLGNDESPAWQYNTQLYLAVKDNNGSDFIMNPTASVSAASSQYTISLDETRHLPYVWYSVSAISSLNYDWHPNDDEEATAWADTPSDLTNQVDKVLDWLFWNTLGYLRQDLATGPIRRDSSDWTTFTTDMAATNYKITLAIPSLDKTYQRDAEIPSLIEVLQELFSWVGRVAWFDYSAGDDSNGNPIWTLRIAKADVSDYDHQLMQDDFDGTTLGILPDPKKDYGNRVTINGGMRNRDPVAASNQRPAPFNRTYSKIVTSEFADHGEVEKTINMRWLSTNQTRFDAVGVDRANEMIQNQRWFQWKAPLFWHPSDDGSEGIEMMDRVRFFQVGEFPTDVAQVRKIRIDYDRASIQFKAATTTPYYTA